MSRNGPGLHNPMLLHPVTQVSTSGSVFPDNPGLGRAIGEECRISA